MKAPRQATTKKTRRALKTKRESQEAAARNPGAMAGEEEPEKAAFHSASLGLGFRVGFRVRV